MCAHRLPGSQVLCLGAWDGGGEPQTHTLCSLACSLASWPLDTAGSSPPHRGEDAPVTSPRGSAPLKQSLMLQGCPGTAGDGPCMHGCLRLRAASLAGMDLGAVPGKHRPGISFPRTDQMWNVEGEPRGSRPRSADRLRLLPTPLSSRHTLPCPYSCKGSSTLNPECRGRHWLRPHVIVMRLRVSVTH